MVVVLSSIFFTGMKTESWIGYTACQRLYCLQLVKAVIIRTSTFSPQVLALFTTQATYLSSLMFHFIQRNNNKKVLVSGTMYLWCVGVSVNVLQMSMVLSAWYTRYLSANL